MPQSGHPLVTTDDDGIAALVMREVELFREQQDRLKGAQARLEWRRDQWQASQDNLDRLEV